MRNEALTRLKSETRQPERVRSPKPEVRRIRGQPAAASDFGFQVSDLSRETLRR